MIRELLTSSLAISFIRFVGMGLGFVMTILLGRLIGPEGLGFYAYAVTCLTLCAIPVSYGWMNLLLRTASKSLHHQEWGETKGLAIRGSQLSGLVTLVFAVGAFFVSRENPEFFREGDMVKIIIILACVLFFDQLSVLRMAVLRGFDKPVLGQISEMTIRPFVLVAVFYVLYWIYGTVDITHAFYALIAASFLSFSVGAYILKRNIPHKFTMSKPQYSIRIWLNSVLPLMGNSGLIVLNTYVDIIVLGLFTDISEIGIYRVAAQIGLLSGFAYMALNMVANQRFAYFRAKNDQASLQSTATFISRIAFVVSVGVFVFFFLFGEPVIQFVFGSEFITDLKPMLILIGLQILSAAVGMANTLLIMSGLERKVFNFTALSVCLNIALCFLLIPKFGIVGAATSTLLATVIWNFALWLYAYNKLNIDTSIFGLKKQSR